MKNIYSLLLLSCISIPALSQDDLSSKLDSLVPRTIREATFKSSRIVNLQSNETVHARTLDFRIAHRFGAIGKNNGGSIHNLYGLDNSGDISIAFEYGITEDLTMGLSRSKHNEDYEALAKYRLLKQTNDNHFPVAITLFGNIIYSDRDNPYINFDKVSTSKQTLRKVSYSAQIIIARKFSPRISFELAPTMVHHNFVENSNDDNTLYALGFAGRVKITKSMAVIADYIYNFSDLRKPGNDNDYYNALGLGLEFETGGHVFSILFTNATSIVQEDFISDTRSSWQSGGIRFGFNISRIFRFKTASR